MLCTVLHCGVVFPFTKDDTNLKRTDKSAHGRVSDVPLQ